MSKARHILFLVTAILVSACAATVPESALKLPPESLQERQIQTRRFDGINEADLLSACAGVLQDLGFNLDEAEAPLGLIVASKNRSAMEPASATVKRLLDMQRRLEDRLAAVGFPKEKRSFKAHLTLGRIRQSVDAGIIGRAAGKSSFIRKMSLTSLACLAVIGPRGSSGRFPNNAVISRAMPRENSSHGGFL